MFFRKLGCLFILLLVVLAAHADEAVNLLYNERPPYAFTSADGVVYGLTATPAENAFRSAGIAVDWVKLPTNRQLSVLKQTRGMNCALGWFKRPDREEFAKFTRAIYQDKPTVALVGRQFGAASGTTLANILAIPGVRVLVRDKFSYGAYIDELLLLLRPNLVRTTSENIQMVQMIQAGRADLVFASEEEAGYLLQQAGFGQGEVRVLRFAEMPHGEKRYLMCSRDVPDEMIFRLNRALPAD